jgi:uncharacterized phage-associated protein
VFSAKAVANEFLDLAKRDNKQLTHLQLQKLVYFAHGWHLAVTGSPLLDERIEAWKYGPVIPSLYREFRTFGSASIGSKATEFVRIDPTEHLEITPSLTDDLFSSQEQVESARRVIKRVWDLYSGFSGLQLSSATHQPGTPWYAVNEKGGVNAEIPDEEIRTYFVKLANEKRQKATA